VRVHKSQALIAGAAALALALGACTSSGGGGGGGGTGTESGGGGGGSKPTGQLIYGEGSDFPENLMPIIAAGNVTSNANILGRVLDGAFRIAPNVSFQMDPDQVTDATSNIVNGQQVIDYKINPKAVWDDGQPITADDYIFTFDNTKAVTDPKTKSPVPVCSKVLGTTGTDQIETAQKVSDTEVKFIFKKGQPFADWKGLFAGASGSSPLLSQHVMDKGSAKANCDLISKGWPIQNGIPAGASNGPWLLQGKNVDVSSKTVTLVPNPKYWGAQPKLARIVYVNIGSDSDTNVKAIQNQEVNMIYPQPQLDIVKNLQGLPGVTTSINFGPSFEHFDFNTRDPLLAHKEVREAIAYAIDRTTLVKSTVGQFSDKAAVLGNRLLVASQDGYEDHSGPYAQQDIAKAKSLLESIGATMGSDGYYSLNGKELSFKVTTTQQNPLRDQTVALAAQMVKKAGIKLTENASADIFEDASKPGSLEAGGFQIALFAWVAGPALSSNNSIYKSLKAQGGSQGQNYVHGSDPAVDDALTKLASAPDPQTEVKYANEADKLLWGDMFTLPLYQKPTLLAYDSNYKGIADNSTQAGPLWNNDQFSVSG
jgi:peptide/nickel transport system substrate-binding protein